MKYITLAIIMTFFALAIAFCILMIAITSKNKSRQRKTSNALKSQGLKYKLNALHTYGLPIAEGMVCTIHSYNDHIDFLSGTTQIKLDNEKVTDMCIKTETEIQQQYVSSVGGAVGGAVLFGPLGAMIGGRAKKKTSKSVTYYLIITYIKAEKSIEYIGFDVSGGGFWQANKMVTDFHKNNTKGNTHIEL